MWNIWKTCFSLVSKQANMMKYIWIYHLCCLQNKTTYLYMLFKWGCSHTHQGNTEWSSLREMWVYLLLKGYKASDGGVLAAHAAAALNIYKILSFFSLNDIWRTSSGWWFDIFVATTLTMWHSIVITRPRHTVLWRVCFFCMSQINLCNPQTLFRPFLHIFVWKK